jgi:hypothetical protein
LKLKCGEVLSRFGFNLKLRRYGEGDHAAHTDSDPANRPDAMLFRQFSHCNAMMWTVLNAENLDACMDPAEDTALASGPDALATTELTAKGKMKLPNLAFDGAFLSLKLSANLLESYFYFQGVFSFLGATITIDVSIKPGKVGGFYAVRAPLL